MLVERAIATPVGEDDVEMPSVTGRPVDERPANSTFTTRAASRDVNAKQVDAADAENKSVTPRRSRRK